MKRRLTALILTLALLAALALPAAAATYSNWFKSNYQEMQNLKILPDQFTGMDLKQPITRGEMCLLAVQAFEEATGNDLELDGTQYFTDTNDTNITKAYEYGIVSGYPDGTFRPDQRITRQEFFKLLENFCYSAAFKPVLSVDANALSQFGDASALSSWAKESAQFCVTYSYVNGTKDASGSVVLDPTGTASRQEAMTMFLRAFKRVKEYYYYAVLTAGVSDDGHDTGETGVTVSDLSKTMYVTAQTLNVRDSWSSGSTLVGTLKYGEAVTVTGRCSNGWMRIQYQGHTAYVSGEYLADQNGGSSDGNNSGSTVTGSGTAAEIARFACSFVGYSYVYGGSKPSTGFDCSGLMYYCLRQYGYSMNRTADDQMDQGTAVSRDELQVGDLVFFGSGSYANHVGMYIGDGNFVHASTPSTGVRINSLNETYYTNRYIGARRIITG